MTGERRPLTPEEELWCDNLKAIYKRKKKELGLSQKKVADLCGWNSQGTVSSYMNGRIPLNTDAKLQFAEVLKVSVNEIDPSMSIIDTQFPAPKDVNEFFEMHGAYLESLSVKDQMRIISRLESIVDARLADTIKV